MQIVAKSWKQIEEVLRENANSVYRALRGPASPAAISRLKKTIPARLPSDLLQSLAIHDGLQPKGGQMRLFNYWAMLPIGDMLRLRKMEGEVQKLLGEDAIDTRAKSREVKLDLRWRDAWIPFLDADGDKLFIDLDPGPKGRAGQIVYFHNAETRREVVAPSLTTWLAEFAELLQSRSFELNERGEMWIEAKN